MNHHWPFLSLMIWLPFLGGILVLLNGHPKRVYSARAIALFFSLLNLFLSGMMYYQFNVSTYAMQFQENLAWIPTYGVYYALGIDGIAMPLILLTTFTTLLVVLASWETVHKKVAQYLANFLIMQGMVIGVFAALDSLLFYIFWEAMLIPMYLSIGIWGSDNRSYAAIKFFLFTFFGSALMLIAFLYLRMQIGSFNIAAFQAAPLNLTTQCFVFIAFFLAFSVKVPMWPLHTWLPDAHTEAPAGGSVILAALMLKMGAYGFLRFSLPITPDASHMLQWPMIVLSLIAIVYIGFIALAQTDLKKLIAYSSVAHMGFVTLGCFMVYLIVDRIKDAQDAVMSLEGAVVQMISHAFGSGALFLSFGMLYERFHTRLISHFGGIAKPMPIFAAFFMIFSLSNVGLPGTAGFVGEFLIILSSFKTSFWITLFAGFTLVIGAAYTLWMYKRVFYGPLKNEGVLMLQDATMLEIIIFVLMVIPILFIGLYPAPLLNTVHSTLVHLLDISIHSKL